MDVLELRRLIDAAFIVSSSAAIGDKVPMYPLSTSLPGTSTVSVTIPDVVPVIVNSLHAVHLCICRCMQNHLSYELINCTS